MLAVESAGVARRVALENDANCYINCSRTSHGLNVWWAQAARVVRRAYATIGIAWRLWVQGSAGWSAGSRRGLDPGRAQTAPHVQPGRSQVGSELVIREDAGREWLAHDPTADVVDGDG